MNPSGQSSNSPCIDQCKLAELELSAFLAAVTALFGPEQAKLSAADWLDAFDRILDLDQRASQDWRTATIIASAQLACRLNSKCPPMDHTFLCCDSFGILCREA